MIKLLKENYVKKKLPILTRQEQELRQYEYKVGFDMIFLCLEILSYKLLPG